MDFGSNLLLNTALAGLLFKILPSNTALEVTWLEISRSRQSSLCTRVALRWEHDTAVSSLVVAEFLYVLYSSIHQSMFTWTYREKVFSGVQRWGPLFPDSKPSVCQPVFVALVWSQCMLYAWRNLHSQLKTSLQQDLVSLDNTVP